MSEEFDEFMNGIGKEDEPKTKKMSDYNKVINDEEGISVETLVEMLNNVVKDSPVYVYEHREGHFPIPVKVTHISTQFGCLYLGTKN